MKEAIYISGAESAPPNYINTPKYWKNGVSQTLSNTAVQNTNTTEIFVDGNDVYVLGTEKIAVNNTKLKVWKNGSIWDVITPGTEPATAKGLFVSGGKVYTSGWVAEGNHNNAKYWIDEKQYDLTDGTKDS